MKAIHAQEDHEAAGVTAGQVVAKLAGMRLGQAAELVRAGVAETLAYHAPTKRKTSLPWPGAYRLNGRKARLTCRLPVGGLPLDDPDELLRRCQRGDALALAEIARLFEEHIVRLA